MANAERTSLSQKATKTGSFAASEKRNKSYGRQSAGGTGSSVPRFRRKRSDQEDRKARSAATLVTGDTVQEALGRAYL